MNTTVECPRRNPDSDKLVAFVPLDPPELWFPEVPADPSHLAWLRHTVERWAARLGIAPRKVTAIVEATFAALTNVAGHAYPGGDGDLDLHARYASDTAMLEITVTDRGTWQDRPDPHCGQGLPLIRDSADSTTITTEPGRTVVSLRWSLHDDVVSWSEPVPW